MKNSSSVYYTTCRVALKKMLIGMACAYNFYVIVLTQTWLGMSENSLIQRLRLMVIQHCEKTGKTGEEA